MESNIIINTVYKFYYWLFYETLKFKRITNPFLNSISSNHKQRKANLLVYVSVIIERMANRGKILGDESESFTHHYQ